MYNLMESSSNANDGLLSNLPDDVLTDVLSLSCQQWKPSRRVSSRGDGEACGSTYTTWTSV